jgi:predicted N-acetyltransferase YhbS
MEILIRAAQIKDSEFIANLSDQLGYKTTNDKIVERLLETSKSEDNCVFVACDGDIVTGWIHAFRSLRIESDSFVEIGGLVVDKDYRKRGIGKMLIDEVIEWAQLKKIIKLRVRSNTIRIATHEFYKNFGFKEIKDQKIFDLDLY